jgi:Fe-S-cluster containining protein
MCYTERMMFEDETPWYVAGLAFECLGCGKCCAGPEEGYVWVAEEEIAAIATSLGLTVAAFRARYVRQVGRRLSLVEKKPRKDCIFLEGNQCRIYAVRPMQCRTWPFWKSNIASPEDWSWAAQRCAGINRGTLYKPEEIRRRAFSTRE